MRTFYCKICNKIYYYNEIIVEFSDDENDLNDGDKYICPVCNNELIDTALDDISILE